MPPNLGLTNFLSLTDFIGLGTVSPLFGQVNALDKFIVLSVLSALDNIVLPLQTLTVVDDKLVAHWHLG